ncbi:MAG TPA: thiamine pyrophosphate-binding protein [Candidatus Dormibacteraeota bacterium]|nr:thiamine pyrophosphate-binding protein [Candidatus Dormibacteraeota bacterium]
MIEAVNAGQSQIEAIRGAGITYVTGVPDSLFKPLIAALEATELDRLYVRATREDHAIALAAGAWLAGEQPLVFMESSGIGTAVDALTSLALVYGMPIVLFIGWAGYQGRDVPHHNVIGEPLPGLLEALGVPRVEVVMPGPDVEPLRAALAGAVERARAESRPVAVLGIPRS